jgi:hypothetical protein
LARCGGIRDKRTTTETRLYAHREIPSSRFGSPRGAALLTSASTLQAGDSQSRHSHALNEFGLWIAIAAAIAAFGKFLDDYYLGNPAKDWVRIQLIKGFIFLEMPLLSRFNPFGPPRLWMIWFSLTYMICLLNYPTLIGLMSHAVSNRQFVEYLKVPYFAILISVAGLSYLWVRTVCFWLLARWIKKMNDAGPPTSVASDSEATKQLAIRIVKSRVRRINTVLFAVMIFWIVVISYQIVSYSITQVLKLLFYAFLVTTALYLVIFIGLSILKILNWLINGLQTIIQHTFDKASSPKGSPFTYFGALIGLAVLIGKIIYRSA